MRTARFNSGFSGNGGHVSGGATVSGARGTSDHHVVPARTCDTARRTRRPGTA